MAQWWWGLSAPRGARRRGEAQEALVELSHFCVRYLASWVQTEPKDGAREGVAPSPPGHLGCGRGCDPCPASPTSHPPPPVSPAALCSSPRPTCCLTWGLSCVAEIQPEAASLEDKPEPPRRVHLPLPPAGGQDPWLQPACCLLQKGDGGGGLEGSAFLCRWDEPRDHPRSMARMLSWGPLRVWTSC